MGDDSTCDSTADDAFSRIMAVLPQKLSTVIASCFLLATINYRTRKQELLAL